MEDKWFGPKLTLVEEDLLGRLEQLLSGSVW